MADRLVEAASFLEGLRGGRETPTPALLNYANAINHVITTLMLFTGILTIKEDIISRPTSANLSKWLRLWMDRNFIAYRGDLQDEQFLKCDRLFGILNLHSGHTYDPMYYRDRLQAWRSILRGKDVCKLPSCDEFHNLKRCMR